MKRFAPLALAFLVVGCGSLDRSDYTEICNQETTSFVAGLRHRVIDPEDTFRVWHRICVDRKIQIARDQLGTGIGLVLGAAGDAAWSINVQRGLDGRFHSHRRR